MKAVVGRVCALPHACFRATFPACGARQMNRQCVVRRRYPHRQTAGLNLPLLPPAPDLTLQRVIAFPKIKMPARHRLAGIAQTPDRPTSRGLGAGLADSLNASQTFFLRRPKPRPASAKPNRARVAGSGTALGVKSTLPLKSMKNPPPGKFSAFTAITLSPSTR